MPFRKINLKQAKFKINSIWNASFPLDANRLLEDALNWKYRNSSSVYPRQKKSKHISSEMDA